MAHRAAAQQVGRQLVVRTGKPIVSATPEEARRRVLKVYKEWQKYAPTCWWDHQCTEMRLGDFRFALKNEFMKNAHLKDLRLIDRLVHKAEVELMHCKRYINNYEHIKNYLFKENVEPKPTDFLSKFFSGKD